MTKSKSLVQVSSYDKVDDALEKANEGQIVCFLDGTHTLFYKQKGDFLFSILDKYQLYKYIQLLNREHPAKKPTIEAIIQLDRDDKDYGLRYICLCLGTIPLSCSIGLAATGIAGVYASWLLLSLAAQALLMGLNAFRRGDPRTGCLWMVIGVFAAVSLAAIVSTASTALTTASVLGFASIVSGFASHVYYQLSENAATVDHEVEACLDCPLDSALGMHSSL